jgi:hypothetical protein
MTSPKTSYEDFPEVQAAEAKLAKLQSDRDATEKRRREAADQQRQEHYNSSNIARDRRVDALLNGTKLSDSDPAAVNLPKLEREVEDYDHAIAKQEKVVEEVKRKAALVIRTNMLPDHKELASEIGDALEKLRALMEKEQTFRLDRLEREDVPFGAPLQALAMPWLGAVDRRDQEPGFVFLDKSIAEIDAYLNTLP